MAQSPIDIKGIVNDTVKKAKDNVTLKPQRDAASDSVSNAIQGAEDTVKGWAGKVKDFLTPSPQSSQQTPKTPVPKYKKGTDYVPKTGPAILHKGEAVLNKEDADKHREAKGMDHKAYDVSSELGGKKEDKPKKEIEHIKTKKAKSGGYVHEHHHTHPEHHPMETHVSADQDAMASHMLQHMGEQNPGEAEADAGQSGLPGAGAAPPQAGTPPPQPGM